MPRGGGVHGLTRRRKLLHPLIFFTKMDIPTVPGSLYTVATQTTCDITDTATGTPIDTVTSGSVTFTAQGAVTTLSDPTASYTKVNFKNAAAALRMLGGGEKYPGFDLTKYAECTNKADMEAVDPNYKNDLTPDGKWVYPLPKLANSANVFQDVQIKEFVLSAFPELTTTYFFMAGNYAIRRFYTRAPKIMHTERWFRKTSLEVFDYNGEVFNPLTMLMTFSAAYNFRTFNAVFGRKMGNCDYAFDGCILDKPSIMRIANSALPTGAGNPFTIGVHVDNQNDPEVLDALALMETNGWALTVQWNGTATAQTARTWGLRKPPIYAKVGEVALSDGTTERLLAWGSYVTNAEARGYMEFGSVEEAREYFNLTEQ